ncbi:claspin [Drosophila navojoa]|nr:claspin [Drosophila navojoa]
MDIIDKTDQIDIEIGGQLEEKVVDVEDHLSLPEIEPIVENITAASEAETLEDNGGMPEISSPTKTRLVTEIVELPKLDLSNLDITPPSKPSTPRISEAIRRLKNEKSSDISPSLKGDANMVIDLETGDMFAKKPTGVDDLLERLMKTREAKKHKTTETVNILSAAHGKLELSKVSIHLHEEEPVNKEQKPGAAYLKMQDHLKTLITNKRMEELRKKQAEEMENSNDEANEDEDMDVEEAEEYEPDAKPNKKELIINDDEEIVEADNAEEIEEGEDEDVEVDADESEAEADLEAESGTEAAEQETTSSESEPEEDTQTSKRKNRIIRAFEDDNSDEDDVDLLQTPKPSKVAPVTADELQLSAHKLFDTEIQRSASDEENELLGLCSGRFTQSEISSAAPTVGALISQIPITQTTGNTQPEELEALCSGTFDTQPAPESNKILSSEEEAKEPLETDKPRQKKLTKKRQKKKAKLGFSDDEESDDDSDNNVEEEEDQEECEIEEPEEVPETFVDYDSEENEIVVEMTKKDRKLRASNFVENEAELSESEWGSADEDEKNMDCYDIELGDEDQFDREKLRNELGQIHARKMLDQDIREVRKIKEMLFEDEEGAVRQRQFRWKNADNGLGFSLDDPRNQNGDAEANEGSGDEENEHLWRKIRYEREQLLLEKGLKEATLGSGSPLSPAVTNSNTTIRKLTIITAKKTTVEVKKSSPFLISKTSQQQQQQRAVRGSFLVRDKETLSKLAGLTKGSVGDLDGTAGTVSVKSAKAKNFVFATLTEEEHENQKRKAADLLNSSSETGINFMKKPRLEPRREKCLIDQLL